MVTGGAGGGDMLFCDIFTVSLFRSRTRLTDIFLMEDIQTKFSGDFLLSFGTIKTVKRSSIYT